MTAALPVVQQFAAVPLADIERMAAAIAQSGLFGVKRPEQALALMLIAQAEGEHPAAAARDYHVIKGRPSLKADAMLARFQRSGGKVRWLEYSDTRVAAVFSHPLGGEVTVDWDIHRAGNVKAYDDEKQQWTALTDKLNYRNYPRQMLRARTISEGVRTVFPGCLGGGGMYTPEEVDDLPPPEKDITDIATHVTVEQPAARSAPPPASAPQSVGADAPAPKSQGAASPATPPATPTGSNGGGASPLDVPLTEPQKRILRASLARAARSEIDLKAKFEKGFEDLTKADFNKVQDWLASLT